MNSKKTLIVYEHLHPWHLALILWPILRKKPIYFIHRTPSSFFEFLEKKGLIIQLKLNDMRTPPAPNPASSEAFSVSEGELKSLNHPLVKAICHLFNSEKIKLAYRSVLTSKLELFFHSRWVMKKLRDEFSDSTICFIPSKLTHALRDRTFRDLSLKLETYENVRIAGWALWFGRCQILNEVFLTIAYSIYHFIQLFLKKAKSPLEPQKIDFIITIMSPLREFANTIRKVDFLLDEEKIHRENSLFIPTVPLNSDQISFLKQKGLKTFSLRKMISGRYLSKAFRETIRLITFSFRAPEWVLYTTARLIVDYCEWMSFLDHYRPKNFITYGDYSFKHISRNILLQQAGTTTWLYIDSLNTGDTLSGNNGITYPTTLFGFLYYDALVSWNEKHIGYMKTHRQEIGRYFSIGCLWSEHVRLLAEKKIATNFPSKVIEAGLSKDHKLLSIFDSTYHNNSPTTYHDGIAFLEGISKLLNEFQNLFVVWKEKKPRWIHRDKKYAAFVGDSFDLEKHYDELAKHPRCFFAGYETNASEILALSDLCISFPFTSTALEAIGAGKKAIFYDPNNKQSKSYYDQFPYLVAHSYEELRETVNRFLYSMSPKEFEEYLDQHIKGKIDSYLDGKALTRFRNLLLNYPYSDSVSLHLEN